MVIKIAAGVCLGLLVFAAIHAVAGWLASLPMDVAIAAVILPLSAVGIVLAAVDFFRFLGRHRSNRLVRFIYFLMAVCASAAVCWLAGTEISIPPEFIGVCVGIVLIGAWGVHREKVAARRSPDQN